MEKSCCVCWKKGAGLSRITKKNNGVSLLAKFKLCISEVSWFPSFHVCTECVKNLNIVHEFREACIKSSNIRENVDQQNVENICSRDEDSNEDQVAEDQEHNIDVKDNHSTSSSDVDNDTSDEDFVVKEPQSKLARNENERKNTRALNKNYHFKCDDCEETFSSSKLYVEHCSGVHGMNCKDIKPFSCDRCPQRFSSSSNLCQHKKYHESIKSNMCSYCGNGFVTKADLKTHEKQHLNLREYKCLICDKSFNTHKDLRSHNWIVHTDPSQWRFMCTICDKPFPIKSNYDGHMRRHLGDKKFACHVCEKKFISKCDLQRHLKSHSEVRDHKCRHCGREYKDKRVLKVHMAKVHGIGVAKVKLPSNDRRFSCSFCMKTYFSKQKLVRHIYSHTGERPFSCQVCDKRFTDKSYVKKHMITAHNADIIEPRLEPPPLAYFNQEMKTEMSDDNLEARMKQQQLNSDLLNSDRQMAFY